MNDPVNHPQHYTDHPSGVECITVTEHMGFCLGNAVKYIWRADLKGNAIEDLEKARWYLDREIRRRYVADARPGCGCLRCKPDAGSIKVGGAAVAIQIMRTCPECGDKRCPGAIDHRQHPATHEQENQQ